jgi:hypothetical protein
VFAVEVPLERQRRACRESHLLTAAADNRTKLLRSICCAPAGRGAGLSPASTITMLPTSSIDSEMRWPWCSMGGNAHV